MPFLLRRLLHSLFLLLVTSMLSFGLISLAPGDFFQSMRMNPEISPSTIEAIRAEHDLNRSVPLRYVGWIRSVLNGDWGFSFAYNAPARPIIVSRARNTLILAGAATTLAWMIALPLGIWAAVYRGRWADWLTRALSALLLATPELIIALLLVIFAAKTGWFPIGAMNSPSLRPLNSGWALWGQSTDLLRHLALPGICLCCGLLPLLFSHVRDGVSEALESSFVTAARGHGIPLRRILLRFALPAAANPLISLLGISVGMLMSSSLLIEVIFSWPGLGQVMLEAILRRDIFLVLDAGLVATALFIAGNLVSDLLLYVSDPRMRIA